MKQNNNLRLSQFRGVYLLSFTLAVLSGCTPYSESFDCPPGRGVGCKSLSVINQMVEKGELPLEDHSLESVPLEGNPLEAKPLEGDMHEKTLIQAKNARAPHSLVKSSPQVPPSQNTHMKVWLTAYEDEVGVFHAPSQVYVALKKGSPAVEKKLPQLELPSGKQ